MPNSERLRSGPLLRTTCLAVLLALCVIFLPAQRADGAEFEQGDANRDMKIDLADFGIFQEHFGQPVPPGSEADFNFDGLVNETDFQILSSNFSLDADAASFLDPPLGELELLWDGMELRIQNPGSSNVLLTGYQIFSETDQLLPPTWIPLGAQGIAGFQPANPSNMFLAELALGENVTLGPAANFSLGAAYTGAGGLLAAWSDDVGNVFAMPFVELPQNPTWNVPAGSWLDPQNWTTMSVPGANDAATIDNGGTATIPAGNDVIVGGLLLRNGQVESLGTLTVQANSEWTGGNLIAGGPIEFRGETMVGGSAPKSLTGMVFNSGALTWQEGPIDFVEQPGLNPQLHNAGLLDFIGDGTAIASAAPAGASLVNETTGTLRRSLAGGPVTIEVPTINEGLVDVQSGGLIFTSGLTNAPTGIVTGVDNSVIGGALVSNGRVAPGAPLGRMMFDSNYMQESDGVLEIEVGGLAPGTEHDQIEIGAATTLGGHLVVPLVNGFVPSAGDQILFLDSQLPIVGSFETVSVPDLVTVNPDVAVDVLQGANDVQLHFVQPIVDSLDGTNQNAVWSNANEWLTDKVPTTAVIANLQNQDFPGLDQRVDVVNENAFVHELLVTGNTGSMTVGVGNARTLSAIRRVAVNDQGVVELHDGRIVTPTITVGSGGRLGGSGRVVGNVEVLGGTQGGPGRVAPGFSPGIIEIEGDYQQSAGGALEIEVGGLIPGDEHDQLIVSGQALLDGRLEVPIINTPPFVPAEGDEIVFLTAEGGVSGTFNAVISPNLGTVNPGVALDVIAGANDVRLRFVAPVLDNQFTQVAPVAIWSDTGSWSQGMVPDSKNVIDLQNAPGLPQRIDVADANAGTHQLSVTGVDAPMTVGVLNGNTLSVTTGVAVNGMGTIELMEGSLVTSSVTVRDVGAISLNNGNLVSATVDMEGGMLVGNGKVEGNLNLGVVPGSGTDATLSPGFGIGQINIDGNYVQGSSGRLIVEIGDIATDEEAVDMVVVSGQAGVDGTLVLDASNFMGPLGPAGRFTFLTAGDLANVGPDTAFDRVETITNDEIYFALIPGDAPTTNGSSIGVGSVVPTEHMSAQGCPLGDMDCDNDIDMDDLPLLALALVDAQQYRSTIFSQVGYLMFADDAGDVNNQGDGLDFDDIDVFVSKLNSSGFGATTATVLAAIEALRSPVPEPCSLLLLGLGGVGIFKIRSRARL